MCKNEVGVLRERVNQMLDDLNRSFERDDEDLKGGWESETQRQISNRFLKFSSLNINSQNKLKF